MAEESNRKNIVYRDISLEDPEIVVEGKEAIVNSLRVFLLSLTGEYPHNHNYGGYLYSWLFKPMDETTTIDLRNAIKIGIKKHFSGLVNLHRINIQPDISEQRWNIEIIGTILHSNDLFSLSENINRQRG